MHAPVHVPVNRAKINTWRYTWFGPVSGLMTKNLRLPTQFTVQWPWQIWLIYRCGGSAGIVYFNSPASRFASREAPKRFGILMEICYGNNGGPGLTPMVVVNGPDYRPGLRSKLLKRGGSIRDPQPQQ